jgi:hypothetical protein
MVAEYSKRSSDPRLPTTQATGVETDSDANFVETMFGHPFRKIDNSASFGRHILF